MPAGFGVAGPLPPPGAAVGCAPICARAIRSRCSTPRAPPARRKASAARTRSISGGRVNTARLLGITPDDALLTPLPLFHTNALNAFYQALLTGASLTVEPRFSASGFCARAGAASRDRHLPARRDGADPAGPPAVGRRIARTGRGSRSPPACRRASMPPFTERFGIALLDGYGSTETNFALGCAIDGAAPRADGSGLRRVRGARRPTTTTIRCRTARRASCCCARASRSPSPPAISACRSKTVDGVAESLVPHRRPRGARGGRVFPFPRPDQGRDPQARRERLRLRGRAGAAERIRRSPTPPSIRCRSEFAEDEVMAAIVLREGMAVQPRRDRRLVPPAPARLRGAALRRAADRVADDRERQDREVPAARAWRRARRLGRRRYRALAAMTCGRGAACRMSRATTRASIA